MSPTTNGLSAPVGNSLSDLVEQLTARLQAGEDIDSAAIVAAHPEHADRLSGLLPALRAVAALGGSGDLASDGPPLNAELGDFRIIRQVGRGGMGVVYEAEQLSLRRRVALKVLPFAATMDPKQLQRFRNEALAAASLHHEHIVPVHAVGCDRGVHYYTMQFIDGHTLADRIIVRRANHPASRERQRPEVGGAKTTPVADAPGSPALDTAPVAALSTRPDLAAGRAAFRQAAEWIAQAAEAIEYAHSMGIVHRDVKPGNLLVDGAGKLWVADFGLARFGPDAGLTMSGALLGTLRYMSPEQAMARHGLADHRVDVYGLGCTLYELLTGKPAVRGEDKADILRHIAFEDPVAPRKVNKAIPAELETIALKCLAKNPSERYPTAGELADDVRRFLNDKSIKAKPPGLRERAMRWSRRHRPVVAASFVVLVLAVVALSVCTFVVVFKEGQVQTAYQAESRERVRAQTNLRTAHAAIDKMLTRLGRDRLAQIPQMEKVRAEVVQDALQFYQRLLQEQNDDPLVRDEMAKTQAAVGDLLASLGRIDESELALRESVRILEGLAAEFPTERLYRHQLAGTLNDLAATLRTMNQPSKAEVVFRQAIDRQESLVNEFPGIAQYRLFLGNMHFNLGLLLNATERFVQAEPEFRRAMYLREGLVVEFPNDPQYREQLATSQIWFGNTLAGLGRRQQADRTFRPAVKALENLVQKSPGNSDFRSSLSVGHCELGQFLKESGRLPEAEIEYQVALAVRQKLADDFPHTPGHRSDLAELHDSLGLVLTDLGRPAEGQESLRRAIAIWKKLVADFPGDADYRAGLASATHNLARSRPLGIKTEPKDAPPQPPKD